MSVAIDIVFALQLWARTVCGRDCNLTQTVPENYRHLQAEI
jgi:hypothetical protein